MKEFRCKFCHKLLFKYSGIEQGNFGYKAEENVKVKMNLDYSKVEIACPKCSKLNILVIKSVLLMK